MRIFTRAALVAALGLAACQQASRLDKVTQQAPAPAATPPGPSGDAPAGLKIDRSGSVEQQLARLQDAYDRNAEALAFLNKVYAQQKAQAAQEERDEPADDAVFAVDVSGDIQAGQVDGPATAPVTIIKAFDFACPYCAQMSPVLHDIVKANPDKVRVVYKNLVVHEIATPAHLASCAAAKQGKYGAFKDAFWEDGFKPYLESRGQNKDSLGEDNIVKIATKVGLAIPKFKADLAGQDCKSALADDMTELTKFHVNATPTLFVNGKEISGAMDQVHLQELVNEQLAIVQKSGVPAGQYYDKVVMAGEKQFRSKKQPKPH